MAKTSGRNFNDAVKATREFTKGIDKTFVTNLKESGLVSLKGMKWYAQRLSKTVDQFRASGKDYSVQQARLETLQKIFKLC